MALPAATDVPMECHLLQHAWWVLHRQPRSSAPEATGASNQKPPSRAIGAWLRAAVQRCSRGAMERSNARPLTGQPSSVRRARERYLVSVALTDAASFVFGSLFALGQFVQYAPGRRQLLARW